MVPVPQGFQDGFWQNGQARFADNVPENREKHSIGAGLGDDQGPKILQEGVFQGNVLFQMLANDPHFPKPGRRAIERIEAMRESGTKFPDLSDIDEDFEPDDDENDDKDDDKE